LPFFSPGLGTLTRSDPKVLPVGRLTELVVSLWSFVVGQNKTAVGD
jgi:hypothetical protein